MKTMRETSWRTLMLMTTVLILVIIFEATVRPYKPQGPLIGPAMGASRKADPNQAQEISETRSLASASPNEPARTEPEPVRTVAEAHPVWLNDNLGDLKGTIWASPLESDDPEESPSSESEDPNEISPPVQK